MLFKTFYRTQRASGHGWNSVCIFECSHFGGVPYVVGYCGEFRENIMQQAGPRYHPGLSVLFLKKFIFWLILVVSGMLWDYVDNNLAQCVRDRHCGLDCEATVHLPDTATCQRTHQQFSAYTWVQRRVQANALAGSSTWPGNRGDIGTVQGHGVPGAPGASVPSPTQMEIDLLTRLGNGSGLSQYDMLGFLEMCNHCSNLFLGSFLCCHITSCTQKWCLIP